MEKLFSDTTLSALIGSTACLTIRTCSSSATYRNGGGMVEQAKGLTLPFVSGVGSVGQRRFSKYTMDGIINYDTNFSNNISKP
ncbi:MAG: hypothetical protein U0X91_30505 [Spirosomataceae bacterium]